MAKSLRVKDSVPMSATLAIHDEVGRLRSEGRKVFHLGFGEAIFPVHPKILEAFTRNATQRSYLPVTGLPELRCSIAAYYRRRFAIEVEPSQVLVGSGSKSLLYAALKAIDGDVILTDPCWVSYEAQARLAGHAVHLARTSAGDGYRLTPEALQRCIEEARATSGKPAALVLNSPNNPTGVMYPAGLLESLAEVARAEGLLVISDEIYALTVHGDVAHHSMARFYPEGTIVTGGLSKHLSLGGWRLGVGILPPGELGRRIGSCMGGVASAIWTTAASPVQHAALVAYADDPEIDSYIEACASIHGRMTRELYRALASLNVPCVEPAGAFYLYPSFAPWSGALRARYGVETCRELAGVSTLR